MDAIRDEIRAGAVRDPERVSYLEQAIRVRTQDVNRLELEATIAQQRVRCPCPPRVCALAKINNATHTDAYPPQIHVDAKRTGAHTRTRTHTEPRERSCTWLTHTRPAGAQ